MAIFARSRPIRNHLPASIGVFAAVPLAFLALAVGALAAPAGSTDLRITKTDSPDPVRVGSTLTYAIAVENLGPLAASGVTVTDSLPKGVDLVSATASTGQCVGRARKVTCSIGSVPFASPSYGGGPTVTIAVVPRQAGTISNTASVKADQKDPIGGNNTATATTRVLGAVSCHGVAATIIGTAGDDHLLGTGGRDVIASLGGDDAIRSLAGRDLVCAGAGSDFVAAGSAADRVFGAAGRDRLVGRGGPDLLAGGLGADLLAGNGGADRLRGGPGFDRCRGGAGADRMRSCER